MLSQPELLSNCGSKMYVLSGESLIFKKFLNIDSLDTLCM